MHLKIKPQFMTLAHAIHLICTFTFICTTTKTVAAVATTAPAMTTKNTAETQSALPMALEGVVRVEVANLVPDYKTPWQAGKPNSGSGTGWLVAPNRFITNAHVVKNATQVVIRLPSNPKPVSAKVLYIAHDCDLAMLETTEPLPENFAKIQPFELNAIPPLNSEVNVVGYPIGGDRLSVTRGVVSRVAHQPYSHTGVDVHLTVQIDAAINPGNSGGPVLQNGKVVGVAFQGFNGATAQNVGYMIPAPVILHFLKDIKDGTYDGYTDLGLNAIKIENAAQKIALNLPDDGVGVMVANVMTGGSADGILKTGDVLLAIDGAPISNNGLIELDGERIDFNEVAERKFKGDSVILTVWRDEKKSDMELILKRFLPADTMAIRHDMAAPHVVYAGLVFQPMSRNLAAAHDIKTTEFTYHFTNFISQNIYTKTPEIVVLSTILPDDINSALQEYRHGIVKSINGQTIGSLKDVLPAIEKPGKNSTSIEFLLQGVNRPLVMNREQAKTAHPTIMANYGLVNTKNSTNANQEEVKK